MIRGALYVKADGEDVPVASCTIDIYDGGVFVHDESVKGSRVTWRRIGTLPDDVMDELRGKLAA